MGYGRKACEWNILKMRKKTNLLMDDGKPVSKWNYDLRIEDHQAGFVCSLRILHEQHNQKCCLRHIKFLLKFRCLILGLHSAKEAERANNFLTASLPLFVLPRCHGKR